MDPRVKIRRISLVRTSHPNYRAFLEELRLSKLRIRDAKMPRTYSDLLGEQLEYVVQKWIQPAGGQKERVLSYEQMGRNQRYSKRFREMDFVIQKEKCLYVGELKVSYSSKILNKAYKQLSLSVGVLRRKEACVKAMLIYVNLSYKSAETSVSEFDEDFTKMRFQTRKVNGKEYKFLHLSPEAIFDWGVREGIIMKKDLLQSALKEAEEREKIRKERMDLRSKGVPESEWPERIRPIADIGISTKFSIVRRGRADTQMAAKLKEAYKTKYQFKITIGAIVWFDNEKGFGVVTTACSGEIFLHINNFKKRPVAVQAEDIVVFRRLKMSNQGGYRIKECRLLDQISDFKSLMSLLGRQADVTLAKKKTEGEEPEHILSINLLKEGTKQIFKDRPEQAFIDTILRFYDRGLEDYKFVSFCTYLTEIAIPLIKAEDTEMMEQTFFCYFYANLRSGVLFQAWKHRAFRFIAYTEGLDYEIPKEIILRHRKELRRSHWKRIRSYSYGQTLFKKSRKKR